MAMVRKQVFITAEQNRRLKLRAAQSGKAEAVIVREGIELALTSGKAADDDWRMGLDKLSGAWAGRTDMQALVRDLRRGGGRRLRRLGIGGKD